MIEQIAVRPGDRVLFLTIPGLSTLERMSARIGHGILVCLGNREQVSDSRKNTAHLANIMFTPATLDEIPWQDCFFNCVIDAAGSWCEDPLVNREVARVLGPGGVAWLSIHDPSLLLAAGLHEVERSGELRGFAKPDAVPAKPTNGLHVLR